MRNNKTFIDIMVLQAAYATVHTHQVRDYCMQRYHDVISSFGGKTSYDSFFFSSRRRHTSSKRDWSSDVCSSDLVVPMPAKRDGATSQPSQDLLKPAA